jgi:hypothetical protein
MHGHINLKNMNLKHQFQIGLQKNLIQTTYLSEKNFKKKFKKLINYTLKNKKTNKISI